MIIKIEKDANDETILSMLREGEEKYEHFDYVVFIDSLLESPQDLSLQNDAEIDARTLGEVEKMLNGIAEKVASAREEIADLEQT